MRRGALTIALAATLWVAGCANQPTRVAPVGGRPRLPRPIDEPLDAFYARRQHPPVRPTLSPVMLFDRSPQCVQADAFAWRSDWPSTEAGYRTVSITRYRLRYQDHNPGWNHHPHVHRHVDYQQKFTEFH